MTLPLSISGAHSSSELFSAEEEPELSSRIPIGIVMDTEPAGGFLSSGVIEIWFTKFAV